MIYIECLDISEHVNNWSFDMEIQLNDITVI